MTTLQVMGVWLALVLGHGSHDPSPPAGEAAPAADAVAATQPAPEPEPPLTRDEALRRADEARQAHHQQRLEAMAALASAAQAALPALNDADRAATQALLQRIERELQAVREGRYVSVLAGEEESLNIAPLAEAHQACAQKLAGADDAYADAMQQILARDREGFVGARLTENLQASIDVILIPLLMDYYWHNGQLDDPPGSFDHTIRLGYRFLELEPREPAAKGLYGDVAWLLWSRWVTWKQDPRQMPVGEGDDVRALQLLQRGSRQNPDSAFYHFDAAVTLLGLAQNHNPRYYDFILEALGIAEVKAGDDAMKLRARMTLGHVYRKMRRYDEARHWYNQVLAMEPDNEIATRILAQEMNDGQPPATQPSDPAATQPAATQPRE
jgi:tetratricopeptide (TPR) repeat protein